MFPSNISIFYLSPCRIRKPKQKLCFYYEIVGLFLILWDIRPDTLPVCTCPSQVSNIFVTYRQRLRSYVLRLTKWETEPFWEPVSFPPKSSERVTHNCRLKWAVGGILTYYFTIKSQFSYRLSFMHTDNFFN